MLARFCADPVWWLYITWLPLYPYNVRHFSLQQIGSSAWVPFFAADAGSWTGGWLSGHPIARGWSVNRERKSVLIGGMLCMCSGIFATNAQSAISALALIAGVLFGFQVWIDNVQTLPSDYFPGTAIGSVTGLGGMGAGIRSYTPILIGAGLLPIHRHRNFIRSRRTHPPPFVREYNTELKMQNYLDLTGKVALVTGASSGIGKATAEVFANLGAHVAIGYHRNQSGAEQVRDRIVAAGGKAVVIGGDMRKPVEIRSVVERATGALGPIDLLINNAGSLVKRLPLRDLTEEGLDDILNVNLKSAIMCSQAVAPSMIERRAGAIVNVVSIAAHNGGGPGAGPYSASKAALIAFTKSLAKELAQYGIRVNAISPGVIDTPFHEVFSTPEMIANFVKGIPMGRVGQSIECAKVIAFLASDAASYMTGETVEVNGGQFMK